MGQQLAAKYIECVGYVNAASWDQLKTNCIASEYTEHTLGAADVRGADSMIANMQDMKTAFPDLKLDPQIVLVDGRNIVAVVRTSGTHQGALRTEMGELPATNKKMGHLFLHRLTLNDENKATEEWVYADMGTMMGQLGQMPKEMGRPRPVITTNLEGAPIIAVTQDDERERSNIALVNRTLESFNSHKLADFAAGYADNAILSDQAANTDIKGKNTISAETRKMLAAFPDAKVQSTMTIGAGDYVVLLATITGTHTGDLAPGMLANKKIAKTGKPVSINFADIAKVQNGKITNVWRFRSGPELAMQLGLTQPGATQPGMQPGTQQPGMQPSEQPGMQPPGGTQPGAPSPGTTAPGPAAPPTGTPPPGTTPPGTSPDTTAPGSTTPGTSPRP